VSVGVSYPVVDRVAALRAAVDGLADLDPAELLDVELADELIGLRREMDRQDAVFARLANAAHLRGLGSADGAASTAAFLRHRAGMREGDAKTAIECGAVADLLGETGQAWRSGEISTGSMRTIVGARVKDHDATLVACEPELLDLARRGDWRSLRRAAAHFRNLARADGSEPRDPDGLHISQLFDGRTVISGELSDVGAEVVVTALHAYVDPPTEDDKRSTSQRYAAALVRIAEVAITHLADDHRTPVQVSVVVDWATLTGGKLGRLDGEFTGPIHPQDVQRLLCDSSISRVITGPDSLPLDVGRTMRVPPAPMRRAVVARDQGCRFPGCNRPPGWCQAHHVVPWDPDGPTEVGNLVLFCDHHHTVIHQPDWIVEFDGRDLRVIKPDGTEVA